jgi:hypothetical protein
MYKIHTLILSISLLLHSISDSSAQTDTTRKFSGKFCLVNFNEVNIGGFYKINNQTEIGLETGWIYPISSSFYEVDSNFDISTLLFRWTTRRGFAVRPLIRFNSSSNGNYGTIELEYLNLKSGKIIEESICTFCKEQYYKEKIQSVGIGYRYNLEVRNWLWLHAGAGFKVRSVTTINSEGRSGAPGLLAKPYITTGYHIYFLR